MHTCVDHGFMEGSALRVRGSFRIFCGRYVCWSLVALLCVPAVRGQGPAPETAPPLFPGGELVSYSSNFTTRGRLPESSGNVPATARPTFTHEGDFNFTWGFYRDFDLTILVPVVANHFNGTTPTVAGTGWGDVMALVKYRFYRRDSARGTTQASLTAGPKIPTGRTDLKGASGNRLPATLQPGFATWDDASIGQPRP